MVKAIHTAHCMCQRMKKNILGKVQAPSAKFDCSSLDPKPNGYVLEEFEE